MKLIVAFTLCISLLAQTPPGTPNSSVRASQLMESTAAAVPGLAAASEPLRRSAEQTLASLTGSPQNAALAYRYLSQVRAYLALSDAFPRPDGFPQTAAEQFSELREAADSLQRDMTTLLEANLKTAKDIAADPNNLKRYADANTKLPSPGKLPRVVFTGDSITDLWRLNEYFTGRDFVNRGIAGQTTTQILSRFLQDVVSLHPKAVLIEAGINDITAGIPATGIEDNLMMMAQLAKANGIRPLFASILPTSRPSNAIQQVNMWLKDYCRRESLSYVDYYAAISDTSGQLPPDDTDDGFNPNSKGYRIMSPVALQAIDRAVAAQSDVPAPAQKRRFGILN